MKSVPLKHHISGAFLLFLFSLVASCTHRSVTENAQALRRHTLAQSKSDTTAIMRRTIGQIGDMPLETEEDCDTFYAAINKYTSELHLSGNNPGAIRMFRAELDILTKDGNPSAADIRQLINIYVSLGTAVKEQGMPGSGLDYYLTGLSLCEDTVHDKYKAMLYNNIGIAYGESGMLDKAEGFFRKAVDINLKKGLHNEASLNYANLVELHMLRGENDKALQASQHSLDRIDGDRPELLAFLRLQQGVLYASKGELDLAMQRYASALKQYREMKNVPGIVETYQHISEAHMLGNRTDSAMLYADKALALARSTSRDKDLKNTLRALSKIYEKEGNKSSALDLLNESIALDDSLGIEENRIRLNNRDLLEPQASRRPPEEKSAAPAWIIVIICLILAAVSTLILLVVRARREQESRNDMEKQLRTDHLQAVDKRIREMTTLSLERIRTRESLINICDELRTVLMELNPKETAKRNRIRLLLEKLDSMTGAHADDEFKIFFESVHPDFYRALNRSYPDLTVKDERLCAFLYLGLNTKEIAAITCREVRSVESARNRLRKKLGLDLGTDLTEHLRSLSKRAL